MAKTSKDRRSQIVTSPENKEMNIEIITSKDIESRIFEINNQQVMIDRDLAELYGVETKVLNQAVKRNIDRFPERFRFQLSSTEKERVVTNCDHLQELRFSNVNPYVFTEQGVAMLSSVLKSKVAVNISIKIIDAFVDMRKFLLNNAQIFQRLERLEIKQISNDGKFEQIFNALGKDDTEKQQGIFFDGQIYDAYKFVIGLIKKAETEIVLIDGYVDIEVLDMLSHKKQNVKTDIYTYQSASIKDLDAKKFNLQYPQLTLHRISKVHDRYLIIDNKELYSIGASLKDLGKKCFSFNKMEDSTLISELLNRLV
ncbi:MAG: ORF6N domain-containing protein [Bacteroidales bacterium]